VTLLAVAVSGLGLVDPATPVIRADDEAFLRGRAVFETLRVYGGRPYRLDEHLARLESSAEALGLPAPDRGELEQLAAAAVGAAGPDDHSLRLFWTPNGTAVALAAEIPAWIEETRARGLRAVTLRWPRSDAPWLLGGVKSTSYAANLAAEAEAKRRGADDAVFVDSDGTVLEGPVTNVWWRRGRTLFTPSLELGILAGVTRRAVLDLAPGLGYRVEEGAYPLAEALAAEELFTSSSVRELLPVVALDGVPIGRGPASHELLAAIRAEALAG
jgi:4-amino-4-deoxychorismate lyase